MDTRQIALFMDQRFISMVFLIGFFVIAKDSDSLHDAIRIGRDLVADAINYG